MKLATLRDGSRDGRLVVVSRDLRHAAPVPQTRTLQQALDDWEAIAPDLQLLSDKLNEGGIAGTLSFDPCDCLSPLPRAYQWADGSAYINHVELVRRARGAELPASFWTDPLIYQGGSDSFLAPCAAIPLANADWGLDLEGEVAVITGDVMMGASPEAAASAIRLVMLANDVSLRNLIPEELAKNFGFFQSKPSSSFSPCAVTPDELGAAWDGERLHRRLLTAVNGQKLGAPNAGQDMVFGFPQLISHIAKTRPLVAGSIIGSGTVSNKGEDGGPGKPVAEGGVGYACLVEQRTVETLLTGQATTPYLQHGDAIRIEMLDDDGVSIFGAIEQVVQPYP
ncbi:fumarylacetoacetate hydrolase family protein [Nevskia ramosa]|uniref:fumarylacetoacetate hydrolase family protein n=1 Tax=Nevskia ramosa TaxID=64002 RepID=UPI003D121DE5